MTTPLTLCALLCAVVPCAQDGDAPTTPAGESSSGREWSGWIERHDVQFNIYGNILARKDDHGIEGDEEGDDTAEPRATKSTAASDATALDPSMFMKDLGAAARYILANP